MHIISRLLLAFLLFGCGSSKSISEKNMVDDNPRPSWVRQKPISPGYFHGVGFAYKIPGRDDHAQMARNNALNDLAGEISVEISAQSLLFQSESNQRVRDTYKSTIMSSTNASLEGYELVGVWENEREIWNFYRLSKSEHARIQREKRDKATEMSVLQWQRAEKEADPLRRFIGYVSALDAVKEYLGEPLSTEVDGERIFLANHLMNALRRHVDEWTVTPSQHVLQIKRGQAIRVPSSFWEGPTAFFTVNHGRQPLTNLPCQLSYTERRNHSERGTTDRNGHVYFSWDRVISQRSQEQLHMRVDLVELAKESSNSPLIISLIEQIREPSASTTIDIISPRVFIRSEERLQNELMDGNPLASAFSGELRKDGFEVNRTAAGSDYILDIRARTRAGNGRGESTQFVTAYLDFTIELLEQFSGQVIYSRQIDGVRGVQLDEERAARETFNRAVRDVQREIYPDMRRKAFW